MVEEILQDEAELKAKQEAEQAEADRLAQEEAEELAKLEAEEEAKKLAEKEAKEKAKAEADAKKTEKGMVKMIPNKNFGYGKMSYLAGETYIVSKKDLPKVRKGTFKVK